MEYSSPEQLKGAMRGPLFHFFLEHIKDPIIKARLEKLIEIVKPWDFDVDPYQRITNNWVTLDCSELELTTEAILSALLYKATQDGIEQGKKMKADEIVRALGLKD